MLEVWEPRSTEAVEGYLRDAGFFTGRAGDYADVFLGYGLARVLRHPTAIPTRPSRAGCRSRLVASEAPESEPGGRFLRRRWEATWAASEYAVAITAVKTRSPQAR